MCSDRVFIGIGKDLLTNVNLINLAIFSSFCLNFQSKPEIELVPLVLAIVDAFDYYAVMFVVCEVSQQFTNEFEGIYKVTDRFDWYAFGNEIKAMLPTLVIILQRPVGIKCFGSFSSNRESFKEASVCIQFIHELTLFILSIFSPLFRYPKPATRVLQYLKNLANDFLQSCVEMRALHLSLSKAYA